MVAKVTYITMTNKYIYHQFMVIRKGTNICMLFLCSDYICGMDMHHL